MAKLVKCVDFLKRLNGHYYYNNSAAIQSVTSGSWTKLTNNGLGTYTSTVEKVIGIDNMYNISTQQFDFSGLSIGDEVRFRFTAVYTILSNNTEIGARMNMAVGHASNYQIQVRPDANFKSTGTETTKSEMTVTMDNQFTIDYPAQLEVHCDNNIQVQVTGYKIFVNKRNL